MFIPSLEIYMWNFTLGSYLHGFLPTGKFLHSLYIHCTAQYLKQMIYRITYKIFRYFFLLENLS